MPPAEQQSFVENAVWQLEVCNACRYCEGYCAVFPALERRRTFVLADLQYLSNLCHDCRACFHACMYAPPHDFGINIPQIMARARRESYEEYALPPAARRIFGGQGRFAAIVTALSVLFLIVAIALTGPLSRLFEAQVGEGAFYRIIPYPLMFIPALAISLMVLALLLGGGMAFWRRTHGPLRDLFDARALGAAVLEVLGMKYLSGGGAGGCTYPSERPSQKRRVLHQLVFYGFIVAFVATALAFLQQDFLGWMPPFPLASWPVALGSVGGIAMIVGCLGLLYVKARADREPSEAKSLGMDNVFLVVLLVVNLTGMLLLALRETGMMGSLLVVHIATVFALYFGVTYGKFAHVMYRFTALVQDKLEQRRR